jgi:hypothetical protein
MTRDDKVVDFPNTEERARRLQAEVERLAQLPLVEWMSKAAALPKGTALKRAKLKQMGRGCSPRKREEEARRESRATTD